MNNLEIIRSTTLATGGDTRPITLEEMAIVGDPTKVDIVNDHFLKGIMGQPCLLSQKGIGYTHYNVIVVSSFNSDNCRNELYVARKPRLEEMIQQFGGLEQVCLSLLDVDEILDPKRLGNHAMIGQSWDNVFFMVDRDGKYCYVKAYKLPWSGGWRIKAEVLDILQPVQVRTRYFLGVQRA